MSNERKGSRGSKKTYFWAFIFALIIVLSVLLFLNYNTKKVTLSPGDKVLVVGKNNLIAVYEKKLAVKIPFEIRLSKEETIGDIVSKKNDELTLEKINEILPEKLDKIVYIKKAELDVNVKNAKNIPETNIGDDRYILTSSLYSMFDTLYKKTNTVDEINENIIVDVLNANGIGGYARKTGELIKKEMSMKYNAANYETLMEESYVVLNDISMEKAQEILMKLPEKYFKIKENFVVPTLANIVVILGKEEKINFSFDVLGEDSATQEIVKQIKNAGYKNVVKNKRDVDTDHSVIQYNKEDYFIAYKISKLTNIESMVEKNSLKNKIEIVVK